MLPRRLKMGEVGQLTFIRRLGVEMRNITIPISKNICDDLATLCKNLVRFCPTTTEFKRGKDVYTPSSISSLATIAFEFLHLALPFISSLQVIVDSSNLACVLNIASPSLQMTNCP